MKNTQRHEAGLIFTKINIMYNHDKKKTYPVDKNAQFISFHNKNKIYAICLKLTSLTNIFKSK